MKSFLLQLIACIRILHEHFTSDNELAEPANIRWNVSPRPRGDGHARDGGELRSDGEELAI